MKTKTLLALAAGIIGFAGSANASLTYDFSIIGDTNWGESGTLHGKVTLSQVSGTSYTATSLFLTSVSGNTAVRYNPSYDYVDPNLNNYVQDNAFTVIGEAITYYKFTSYAGEATLGLNGFSNGLNGADDVTAAHSIWNTDGLSGTTFTAAVPEPSALALLGLGAAGLVARRRRVA